MVPSVLEGRFSAVFGAVVPWSLPAGTAGAVGPADGTAAGGAPDAGPGGSVPGPLGEEGMSEPWFDGGGVGVDGGGAVPVAVAVGAGDGRSCAEAASGQNAAAAKRALLKRGVRKRPGIRRLVTWLVPAGVNWRRARAERLSTSAPARLLPGEKRADGADYPSRHEGPRGRLRMVDRREDDAKADARRRRRLKVARGARPLHARGARLSRRSLGLDAEDEAADHPAGHEAQEAPRDGAPSLEPLGDHLARPQRAQGGGGGEGADVQPRARHAERGGRRGLRDLVEGERLGLVGPGGGLGGEAARRQPRVGRSWGRPRAPVHHRDLRRLREVRWGEADLLPAARGIYVKPQRRGGYTGRGDVGLTPFGAGGSVRETSGSELLEEGFDLRLQLLELFADAIVPGVRRDQVHAALDRDGASCLGRGVDRS